jgi:hypothetical protein
MKYNFSVPNELWSKMNLISKALIIIGGLITSLGFNLSGLFQEKNNTKTEVNTK